MNPITAAKALHILRGIRLPRNCRLRLALARALRADRNLLRSQKCAT